MKRILVIGLGNMGLNHISLLPKTGVTLFASDPAAGSRAVAGELYGVTECTDQYRTILDAHAIDLAIVCSPPATHYEVAMDLVSKGIPTYVEKPGFETVEAFDRIQAAAQKQNVPFRIGTQLPYAKDIHPVVEKIVAGGYGPLRYIEFEDHAPYFGSAKSGCANQATITAFLADMLPHPLSLIAPVAEELTDLSVRLIRERDGGAVGALFMLQLDGHIDCTLRLDFGSAQVKQQVSYNFTARSLLYDFKLSRWLGKSYLSGNPLFSRMFPNISVGAKRVLYGLINPVRLLLNLSNSYAGASAFALSLMETTLSEQMATGEIQRHRKVIAFQERCMARLKPLIEENAGVERAKPSVSPPPAKEMATPEIIVTGANGFIGLSVLKTCIERGRQVLAITRSHSDELEALAASGEVTLLKIERYPDLLALEMELPADTPLLHLAAPISGGYSRQANATVEIMDAVIAFSLKHRLRLYHVGSITTCATSNYRLPSRLREMEKERRPHAKGAYTFAKHLAERSLAAAAGKGLKCNVLHPGIVWSESKVDNVLVKLGSVMQFDLYAGGGSRRLPEIPLDELVDRMLAICDGRFVNRQEHLLISDRVHSNRSFYGQYLKSAQRRALFIPRPLLFAVGLFIDKVRGRAAYPKIGVQLSGFSAGWPTE